MHDKSMTKSGFSPRKLSPSIIRLKHSSAVVPIYQGEVCGCNRYTLCFPPEQSAHMAHLRFPPKSQSRGSACCARIQEGLSPTNDLSVSQRQCYLTLERMITPLNIPPVAATPLAHGRSATQAAFIWLGPVPMSDFAHSSRCSLGAAGQRCSNFRSRNACFSRWRSKRWPDDVSTLSQCLAFSLFSSFPRHGFFSPPSQRCRRNTALCSQSTA